MKVESIGIHVTHPLEEDLSAKITVEAGVFVLKECQVFRLTHTLHGRTDITGSDMVFVQQMIAQLFDLIRIQLGKGYLEIPVMRDNAFRGSRQVPLSGIITMRKVH